MADITNPQTDASQLTTGTLASARGGTGVSNSANLTVSTATSIGRGQYQGTNTNDSATAGNIGEYVSSSQAANVTILTGAATDVTSVSLTAGDWDCEGNIVFNPAATTVQSSFFGWISSTSATFPTPPNGGALFSLGGLTISAGTVEIFPTGRIRFSLSGTTTIYLSAIVNFTVLTEQVGGFLGCRRVR